jgi:mxaA protein
MRLVLAALALLVTLPARAQILAVTLTPPPRAVGLITGDTLVASATVKVGPDTQLDAASLPATGPVSSSIDIRSIGISSETTPAGRRYVLRLVYQDFAAPDYVRTIDVPGYQLAFRRAGQKITALVPGFSFLASPIQNANQVVVDASALRQDHLASRVDVATPRLLIAAGVAIALLAACALAAILGVVAWPFRRAGPFAAALHAIKRGAHTDHAAALLLHRAFDETAGTRVFAEDLENFFGEYPRFAALRSDIEKFFAASRALFFGAPGAAAPPPPEPLARALTRAERRR